MATVLLMNASGKQMVKANKTADIVGTRKNTRRDVIQQIKASVVLVQESDINIDSFLPRTGRYPKFGSLGSKQAAILFRTEVFELSGCASLRREMSSLCEELEKTDILRTENEVMPRLCVGQLQMLKNDLKFLFVSWSGPAYADIERRKLTLKDMLTLIDMYTIGKPVYVIIGGEFNLKHSDLLEIVGEYQHFNLSECSREEKYPNKTSFFIVSQPMSSMVGDVHILEIAPYIRHKYHIQPSELKHVLNHDPLFLNIHV